MKYDLFICHASEDKPLFVRELATTLLELGISVWYDELSLKTGDSVRRSIEKGILQSRAGVIVLSPRFFKKEWPQRELDSLYSLEIGNKQKIFPIWLDINYQEICSYSPLIADKVALIANKDILHIAKELKKLVNDHHQFKDSYVKEVIHRYFDEDENNQKFLLSRCLNNLNKLASYNNSYDDLISKAVEKFDINEEAEIELYVTEKNKQLIKKFDIPSGTWLSSDYMGFPDVLQYEEFLTTWCNGLLGDIESYEFYFQLNEGIDTDALLIFFSLANDYLTPYQRELLTDAIISIGSRNLPIEMKPIDQIHSQVHKDYYRIT